MKSEIGFDNERYIQEQTEEILQRVDRFNNKLYLEFGGKLLFDYHAARVLPGYDPNVKMRLLQELKDKADIILCIYAGDIERKKIRADFGITYDADAMKLIDDLQGMGHRRARCGHHALRRPARGERCSRTSWNGAASRSTPTASPRAIRPTWT